MQKYPTDDQF